jgi:RNA polymerase sigma-70 factor (ECF subfamily)
MATFLDWVSDLATTHTRALGAVARAEGLTANEAVDAVQEAFITLLGLPQARRLANEREDAEHLMATLVRNHARNQRRRHHRKLAHHPIDDDVGWASDAPSTDALISDAERHVALLGCVSQLAEVQRRVVTLRMLEELSASEVAASLSLSANHVGVLLHRAKGALADCLAQGGID